MSKARSLKRELVFDLSLLTFSALILSSGFLIILLRLNLPADFEPLAKSYLASIDQGFKTSEAFNGLLQDNKLEEIESFQSAFGDFSRNFIDDSDWSKVGVLLSRSSLESARLKPVQDGSSGLWPRVYQYRYSVPYKDEYVIQYTWSINALHYALDRYKYWVFFFATIVGTILVFIGYHLLFRRNILVPIKNLSVTADAFLQENWSARCVVERLDELGQIGEALNEMARSIQEKEKKLVLTIQSLQKANEEIEVQKNEQLQIEKLASVGRLAAGVAHEVGNPLGAISGYIDILKRSLSKDEKGSEDVDLCNRIETETNRISKIIRALLQQARPPQDRIRPVSLRPVLEKSVELAQIPDSIKVEYLIEEDAAEALCEKDQLVQVILNLLINARHAVEAKHADTGNGKIELRIASRKLPNYEEESEASDVPLDTSVVRALSPQTYWVVRISDNGVGISEEDKKKLFEPFFSTKGPGKGTGLGLYVAKSIIESFRGAIVVQSAEGHGTSFSIFLPMGL